MTPSDRSILLLWQARSHPPGSPTPTAKRALPAAGRRRKYSAASDPPGPDLSRGAAPGCVLLWGLP